MSRLIGLDIGDKRIGVAVSDDRGKIAVPHGVVYRTKSPEVALKEIAQEIGSLTFIVGLPLDEEGLEGEQCEKIRRFCRRLEKRIEGLNIIFFDEYGTSIEAKQRLKLEGLSERKLRSKGVVDARAASIILQQYLDQNKEQVS